MIAEKGNDGSRARHSGGAGASGIQGLLHGERKQGATSDSVAISGPLPAPGGTASPLRLL